MPPSVVSTLIHSMLPLKRGQMDHLWITFAHKNAILVVSALSLCSLGSGFCGLEVGLHKLLVLSQGDLMILLIVSPGILLQDGRVGC